MGQAQLRLFSPADEAGCYHDTARQGFFSLLMATGEGSSKKQDSYRLSQMPVVLSMLDHSRDTWLSQAEFIKPNRRVVNLARIGLLFADLDTYREPWAQGRSPEQLAAAVMFRCYDEGVPPPSILVFSGRGVQAKWLLDGTLPRQALPRWNACQRYLIDRLAGLGADPAAKDASRVLRLVNTVNSKSGEVCRVIHVEQGPDGEPIRYNFEYLAEALLPLARWHNVSLREEPKFFGHTARLQIEGQDVCLLIPATYMNLSGKAVAALARFYQIEPEAILVARRRYGRPSPAAARRKIPVRRKRKACRTRPAC